MKIKPNKSISHYRILSEIGKGGMGEVYLALDTRLDRKVALKILPEEFVEDSERMGRFVREAKSASALNHPNIITIYEIAVYEGKHLIAMEFIDGKTLTDYSKSKRLRFSAALDIAIRIASALEEAHAAGIVHRDIKPDNIMLRPNGHVKILDFGIAKLLAVSGDTVTRRRGDAETPPADENDKTLIAASPRPSVPGSPNTTPGMIIGTANYMSPEQATGKEIDPRSDIFSFGVVFYEMVSGRLPFGGDSPLEVISSILKDEPKSLAGTEVPGEFVKIIIKCLRKNPDERYPDMKGLLSHLKEVKQDLEFQDKLEKTIQPQRDLQETRIMNAETDDESGTPTAAEQRNDTITIKKSGLGKAVIAILAILLLSAIGFGYWYLSSGNRINSIAVMPFINESNNEDIEYLSDGMTETLISSLTNIPNLSVKSSSTVFYYKGKNATPKQLGEELGVEAVLLGKIVQRNDDLVLRLELVDTKTLDAIWSESYNRKMSDLVSLQSEIARSVSDNLRLKLTTSEQEKVVRSGTASSEAQQLYLKGLFHFNNRFAPNGNQEIEKGVRYFKQAIEKDPNYALPYAGLAASYSLMAWGDYDPREYLPKGKEAALKALELDPDLAEAHAALGNVLRYSYDWKGGERSLLKAIEVDPKYSKGHQWYANYLATRGFYDDSLKQNEKALELDPLDRTTHYAQAVMLMSAEKYDEALIQAKKINELFPESAAGPLFLRQIYFRKGMEREGIEQWWIMLEKAGVSEATIQAQKDLYKKRGLDGLRRAFLERVLAENKTKLEKDKNAFINYNRIAFLYAELKEKEKTLEYLNKAYQQRDPQLTDLKRTRRYDFLRDEPEFQELLKKTGFPEQ